jgi:DHA1 family bicyclomycin/chloramphenicol resistance-like MFS transporter
VFLMQHLHLGPEQFLYMFGPAVSGIMFGAWLSGRMAGRRGARETVTIGYVLMLSATLANVGYNLFFPPSLLPCVLPLALYTTGMSLVAPTITLNLMDQFPELRGTVSSLQGFGQTMLGSLVAGVISPLVWGSPLTLALTMASFLFLGSVALFGYRRHMASLRG